MRIIAGTCRSRTIKAPPGRNTRPTTDRVREALFSLLEARGGPLAQKCVLDLYAGSGALGLEALSRGAQRAYFVENDRASLAVLRQNIASLDFSSRAIVLSEEVMKALAKISGQGLEFDLILADPPYALDTSALLQTMADSHLLVEDGLLSLEHDRAHEPAAQVAGLQRVAWKKYGQTFLSIYQQKAIASRGAGR